LWSKIRGGGVWKGIIKNRNLEGKSYYNNTVMMPIVNEEGEIDEFISAGIDITDVVENKNQLELSFLTDRLTGLGNRYKLLKDIEESNEINVIVLNVIGFKHINSSLGNDAGDQVLRMLANDIVAAATKDKCRLYRDEADHFCILETQSDIDTVIDKVKKLISHLSSKYYTVSGEELTLSFSCGIAYGTGDLLPYANSALSESKKTGQELVVKSPQEVQKDEDEISALTIINNIKSAIDENRVLAFFQPIYSYGNDRITKYECLMRIQNTDGSMMPPFAFMDIAKSTRLYQHLTRKVFDNAVQKFKNNDFEFSINISNEDIMNSETMDYIYHHGANNNVLDRLVIEIVESEELTNYDNFYNILEKFRAKGTKFSIDDFGSGYSNYEYLLTVKAEYIKIDGSIVKLIGEDPKAREVIKSIIKFSEEYEIATIAEFVSSKELSELLKEIGVEYAQGYYHGKPSSGLIPEKG
jgi:diguanylate cyclase (GGDEF)-like protein